MTKQTKPQADAIALDCSDANVDVWVYQSEHMDEPFITRDAALILDHIKESLEDWQSSPIANGEKINLHLQYREVTINKFREWQRHGLIS
jgi:hypothetical protein